MKRHQTLVMVSLLTLVSCNNVQSEPVDLSVLSEFSIEARDTYDNHFAENERLPDVQQNQAADPFILRFNGTYYLYATTGGNKCLGWKSNDLLQWEVVDNGTNPPGYVYEGSMIGPWAPEVRYINGYFYLVTSFSGGMHFLLKATSPEGPFELVQEEAISGNEIDGSFFVDTDETVYITAASNSGIKVHVLNESFSGYKAEKFDTIYMNTKLGRWNEGPYITQRFGKYYLTWTGVDCYAPSYRVHYNYFDGESAENVRVANAFAQTGGPVLLKTDSDYCGLGHSANFLGPDLDSHYISYHDLTLYFSDKGITNDFTNRYFNFARLSFNGSKLVADSQERYANFVPRRPEFEARGTSSLVDENGFYLSPISSKDRFTSEYNLTGHGQMVFSYLDSTNHHFVDVSNNQLNLYEVSDGVTTLLTSATLKNHNESAMHTIRVNYGDDTLNVYYDDIEKVVNYNITLPAGKIGYRNISDSAIGYTALSLVGHGSSDKEEYQKYQSLANQFDDKASLLREGSGLQLINEDNSPYSLKDSYSMNLANYNDRATYKIYSDAETKAISLRVSPSMSGKRIGVRINDGERREVVLPEFVFNDRYLNVNLGSYELEQGRNYVSIENIGDTVVFASLKYDDIQTGIDYSSQLTGESKLVNHDFGFNDYDYTPDGIRTYGDNNNYFVYDENKNLTDVHVSAKISYHADLEDKFSDLRSQYGQLTQDKFALSDNFGSGLLIAGNNHEYYTGGFNYEPIMGNVQGLFFGLNSEKIFIRKMNYSDSETLFELDATPVKAKFYEFEMIQKGNEVECLLNGTSIYVASIADLSLVGEVALYSFHTASFIKDFTLKA